MTTIRTRGRDGDKTGTKRKIEYIEDVDKTQEAGRAAAYDTGRTGGDTENYRAEERDARGRVAEEQEDGPGRERSRISTRTHPPPPMRPDT